MQRPGQGVGRVHGVAAVPLGAGRAQGGLPVAVVGGGEGGLQVGFDTACRGRAPSTRRRARTARAPSPARRAPRTARRARRAGRAAGRGRPRAPGPRPHRPGRHSRSWRAGPALQGGQVRVVGGEGAGVVVQGGRLIALAAGELAELGGDVGHVGGGGGDRPAPAPAPAAPCHVAAQLADVRVPGEDGDAGAPRVGGVGGPGRLGRSGRVRRGRRRGSTGPARCRGSPSARGPRTVRRPGEVVPGGGEGGAPGQRLRRCRASGSRERFSARSACG